MNTSVQVRYTCKPGALPPEYHSSGAAGADLRAYLAEPVLIPPMGRLAIPTGISIELAPGYEAQVRPRSGLALSRGITCLNSPGTIDSDYRGEIKVILVNLGDTPFEVEPGARIAQLVISAYTVANFLPADALTDTERGGGGFGSTGAR